MHAAARHPLANLPDPLPVEPLTRPFDAIVRPPGSKSLTNRVLLLASLARGVSVLRGLLLGADDTERMIEALNTLGARVERSGPASVVVHGVGGRFPVPERGVEINLNNAGTATRFLAAASMLATGPVTIDGNHRMRERPIGELVSALRSMGVEVHYLAREGHCPIRIIPPTDLHDIALSVEFGQTASSQFISGVLLAAPFLPRGLTVRLIGEPTSGSYIRMTLDVLASAGASLRTTEDLSVMRIGPSSWDRAGTEPGLDAFVHAVEPDASAATYLWSAAAICPGSRARVEGIGEASAQGDAMFPDLLARMGAKVAFHGDPVRDIGCAGPDQLDPVLADMENMPDAAVTLAVVCAFASGTSVIRGVRTLRVKESDRIEALRIELGRVGVEVNPAVAGDDGTFSITPPEGGLDCSPGVGPVAFETYQDHRMAMALSLIGLRRPGISIRDPGCVAKTYPGFWSDLARLRR